ncbi:MAG: glycosyltransferase [Flavicella sp.]
MHRFGLIIPCYNFENVLDIDTFSKFLRLHPTYHLCFVNNGSKDKTLSLLEQLKLIAPNQVSVVDIKKKRGTSLVVRAGARYLYTRGDLECITYVPIDVSQDYSSIQKQLKSVVFEKSTSSNIDSKEVGKGSFEKRFFKNLALILSFLLNTITFR